MEQRAIIAKAPGVATLASLLSLFLISPRSMAAAIMLYAARSLHYHQVVA
jgi:hypothetical protein